MVNLIIINEDGHKIARPVTNREDYFAQRNAPDNVKNFYDARSGDEQAKGRQVQYCYNDLLPDGVLRGCCHPSSTFAHDIDCGNQEEQMRIKDVLLEKKDEIEYGLSYPEDQYRYIPDYQALRELCRVQRENGGDVAVVAPISKLHYFEESMPEPKRIWKSCPGLKNGYAVLLY